MIEIPSTYVSSIVGLGALYKLGSKPSVHPNWYPPTRPQTSVYSPSVLKKTELQPMSIVLLHAFCVLFLGLT